MWVRVKKKRNRSLRKRRGKRRRPRRPKIKTKK
jgi:hypothetical protein